MSQPTTDSPQALPHVPPSTDRPGAEDWPSPSKIPGPDPHTSLSALALEHQDLVRLEARTDTKATIVVSIAAALAAGAGALLAGLLPQASRWGWWISHPALALALAVVLLVMCVVNVLRQVQPVDPGQLFGEPERQAELQVMGAADWYSDKLETGGPILAEKFRVIGAAVNIIYGAVFLLFVAGASMWVLALVFRP